MIPAASAIRVGLIILPALGGFIAGWWLNSKSTLSHTETLAYNWGVAAQANRSQSNAITALERQAEHNAANYAAEIARQAEEVSASHDTERRLNRQLASLQSRLDESEEVQAWDITPLPADLVRVLFDNSESGDRRAGSDANGREAGQAG